MRFRGVRSPRRSHLKPNPHGRLWICPPDLPDCDPREAIGSEVVAKRKRAEAFEAHFFVKTGVSIPEGAWLVIRLADARLKLRTKRWGTVGASDFRIGTARARFEEPLELQHDNFSARVTCLRGG